MEFVSILENGSKFDEIIKKKPSFVKFYHPSCGHCREMAPQWDALKDEFKNIKLNVNIIEVHADTLGDIKSDCAKNIPGYPTIMEVKQNGKAGKEYNGNRNVKDLKKFILKTFKNKSSKKMTGGGKRKSRKTTKRKTRKSTKRKTNKRKTKIKA
tara:strand:+ start:8696 stop:9157 length:462 start_codon:yes stop_codon:yes gene_type:complete